MKQSRRNFLARFGLGMAMAPFLPRSVFALDGPAPKRFLVFFSSNGTIVPGYGSSGSGSSYDLGNMLAPLEPFKSKLLVLRGLDQRCVDETRQAHSRGLAGFLTGRDLGADGWGSGISVDQHIANQVGTGTVLKSLELGVAVDLESSTNEERMCYRGPSDPLPPEDDPVAAYARVFAGVSGGDSAARRQLQRRASVLDFVREDLSALRRRSGAQNSARIDAHAESLRAMEQSLSAMMMAEADVCSPTAAPGRLSIYDAVNYPAIGRAQIDIMVAAMACDLTRIGSIMFSGSISNQTFPWLGISSGHHGMSHNGSGSYPNLSRIKRWHAEQFLYLLQKMDAIHEDGGTMLDNSVVLWGSECGDGRTHDMDDMRFVLAGSCGGHFRTGRRIAFSNRHHADLLVTIMQAMGVDENSFGRPGFSTGAISELT